jgi:hypothetical protein
MADTSQDSGSGTRQFGSSAELPLAFHLDGDAAAASPDDPAFEVDHGAGRSSASRLDAATFSDAFAARPANRPDPAGAAASPR